MSMELRVTDTFGLLSEPPLFTARGSLRGTARSGTTLQMPSGLSATISRIDPVPGAPEMVDVTIQCKDRAEFDSLQREVATGVVLTVE